MSLSLVQKKRLLACIAWAMFGVALGGLLHLLILL